MAKRFLSATIALFALTFSTDVRADLDADLTAALLQYGFSGEIEQKLISTEGLNRPVKADLADIGRNLFFDPVIALHRDNTCSGCHAPFQAFGDTQSIAIGVDNFDTRDDTKNRVVGPDRGGPRNQRRTPTVINNAFYPRLMWDGRFSAGSQNPFNNDRGFQFPLPEGSRKFPALDAFTTHLLTAQAHIPVTELPEMAGFTGTKNSDCNSFISKQALFAEAQAPLPIYKSPFLLGLAATISADCDFDQFDNGKGLPVPPRNRMEDSDFRNEPIRTAVERDVNSIHEYRTLFSTVFLEIKDGALITYDHIAAALAEFEFTLTFANAPLDKFGRREANHGMTDGQKRGALLFFGKANCATCHSVRGASNEMFSDFANHNVGTPQLYPTFGKKTGNVQFQRVEEMGSPAVNDFGAQLSTGIIADRYKFRTAPLRNLKFQSAFLHDGAFKVAQHHDALKEAIRYHLDPISGAKTYDPAKAGVPSDLTLVPQKEYDMILARLDPLLRPIILSESELNDLVEFVRDGLTDERTDPANLCKLVPAALPSGLPVGVYQGCP